MSAYRFCRSDDIALLVDALNRCWTPYVPGEPLMTPVGFKRLIRDQQVWCSSCMVAFSGADPIGVLIGAKRASGTLIHTIAVHPDHLRDGHGRHLLTSLGSKLAILGPPRLVAEVPAARAAACELFRACGYTQEAGLTDYVWETEPYSPAPLPRRGVYISRRSASDRDQSGDRGEDGGRGEGGVRGSGDRGDERPQMPGDDMGDRFVIPVTIDDLAANDLLEPPSGQTCWARSAETLAARKDDIAGLAIASDERIEAYVLHANDEIIGLRSLVDDDGRRLKRLLAKLHANGTPTFTFAKVHPAEMPSGFLETLGFRRADEYVRFAATARPD